MPYLSMDHQLLMVAPAEEPYDVEPAMVDGTMEEGARSPIPWAPDWQVLRGPSLWIRPEVAPLTEAFNEGRYLYWASRESWPGELRSRYEREVLREKLGSASSPAAGAASPVAGAVGGGYLVWAFGNGPELADELLGLVLEGTKTATCGSVAAYEQESEPLPEVGDISVVTDGRGVPGAIIRTTEAEVRPFGEVDARFAYDEGEGDRSYEFWRRVHEAVFRREQEETGVPFSEKLPVVCERFALVDRFEVE